LGEELRWTKDKNLRELSRNNLANCCTREKPAGGKELIEIRDERLGKNRRKG
jgi:hypothetical protein